MQATLLTAAASASRITYACCRAGLANTASPNANVLRYGSHLSGDKARSVLDHLREGNGTSQTGRLVGVHRETATRLNGGPDSTLKRPTTSTWLFPPRTREVQFDENWVFVAKQQENCDPANPADARKGDYWDHVAYDPEHRLSLAVIPGSRSIGNAEAIVPEVKQRLGGEPPELITSDEAPAYATAIEQTFGVPVVQASVRPGRPRIAPQRRLLVG